MPAAASRNSSSRWRWPAWRPEWMEFSLKRTTIRRRLFPMARMPCRWPSGRGCWGDCRRLHTWCADGQWTSESLPNSALRGSTVLRAQERGLVRMSLETGRRVLRIEAQALADVMARLDGAFARAVDLLFACKGRVAVTGM